MGKSRFTSPAQGLLEEVESIELLMDEISPEPSEIEEYWQLSLHLIALVGAIQELTRSPELAVTDLRHQSLRTELTALESRIMELSGAQDIS